MARTSAVQRLLAQAIGASGLVDNMAEAIRRAIPKLPKEVQAKALELLTPTNLAIMGTVFAAWVASHAFGAGEVADLLVAVYGALVLGWDALTVAKLLYSFVRHCMPVATSADLEAAANEFAQAVSLAGIDVVTAFLLGKLFKKARGKVGKATEPGRGGTEKVPEGGEREKSGEGKEKEKATESEKEKSKVADLLRGGAAGGGTERAGGLWKTVAVLVGGYFGIKWLADRERKGAA